MEGSKKSCGGGRETIYDYYKRSHEKIRYLSQKCYRCSSSPARETYKIHFISQIQEELFFFRDPQPLHGALLFDV